MVIILSFLIEIVEAMENAFLTASFAIIQEFLNNATTFVSLETFFASYCRSYWRCTLSNKWISHHSRSLTRRCSSQLSALRSFYLYITTAIMMRTTEGIMKVLKIPNVDPSWLSSMFYCSRVACDASDCVSVVLHSFSCISSFYISFSLRLRRSYALN